MISRLFSFSLVLLATSLLSFSFIPVGFAQEVSLDSVQTLEPLDDSVFQDEEALESPESPRLPLNFEDAVGVGKAAIFDASAIVIPDEAQSVVYRWDFGDGTTAAGIEVVHSYDQVGSYPVYFSLEVDGEVYADQMLDVFVYNQLYLFITDQVSERQKIDSLVAFAKDRGVHVELISSYQGNSEFIVEEYLLQRLNESLSLLELTDEIIVWTRGSTGLTLLSRFAQNLTDPGILSQKELVIITDQRFVSFRNIAEGTYRTLSPQRIVLTRSEALWMLFEQTGIDSFIVELEKRGIQYDLIDRERSIHPLNFMSFVVNYIVEKGVPSNSLILVLMLPVIATIVAFFKQVVGLTTMGVYTPSIITLSFLALDIKFGLLILFVILFFGSLTRGVLRRYRLLYIPRMAIVLSIVSLTILAMLMVGAYFNITQLVSISIFPMLIMSTMVEKFVSVQGSSGVRQALAMIGSTVFVAAVAYYVVEWSLLKTTILAHPELIFVFLLLNIFLGRWTGLRVLEYARFREILRHSEE